MKQFLKFIFDIVTANWKVVLVGGLAVLCILLGIKSCNQENEIKRLSDNYYAMCEVANSYHTKMGRLATQTRNQVLTINELNAQYSDAKDMIKDLNLKIKNLEQYQHGTVTVYEHDTVELHDTIFNNTVAKTGSYSDDCFYLDFIVTNDNAIFDADINVPIDIFITTQKDGKWYKFWTWPRKKVTTTTAVSKCNTAKIEINSCTISK